MISEQQEDDYDDKNFLERANIIALQKVSVAYQIESIRDIYTNKDMVADARDSKYRLEKTYSQSRDYKCLYQIPNSNLILRTRRKMIFDSAEASIELFETSDRLKTVSSIPVECICLQVSSNDRRKLVAGLPSIPKYHFQLLSYKDNCLKLLKKSVWSWKNKMLFYTDNDNFEQFVNNVDFHQDGLRIATLDRRSVIRITDVDTDQILYKTTTSSESTAKIWYSSSCKWTKDTTNRLAILTSSSNGFRFFDADKQEYSQFYCIRNNNVISRLDISNEGQIALGLVDGSIHLYDSRANSICDKSIMTHRPALSGWDYLLNGMNWNSKNENQIMCYINNSLKIKDIRNIDKDYYCELLLIDSEIQTACFL